MTDLERRYSRLLLLFYPAGYRRERETELTGTYLEFADPGRRWPSMADAIDLAVGGSRERVRGTGFSDGFRLAGTLALLTATALAAAWSFLELRSVPLSYDGVRLYPSFTLGIGVWAIWLLAAAVQLAAPGRPARLAIIGAVLATVAVITIAAAGGHFRPPLFVLVPQAVLGIVALGGADRRSLWIRLAAFAAAAVAVPTVSNLLPNRGPFFWYDWAAAQVLPATGIGLLIVVMLLGIGLAVRGDYRGGWALLVLSGPIGLLSLHIVAGVLDGSLNHAPTPTWAASAAVAVVIAVAWPALVALAITVRRRPVVLTGTDDRCATCGAPIQR
jgi:hypothetical protein